MTYVRTVVFRSRDFCSYGRYGEQQAPLYVYARTFSHRTAVGVDQHASETIRGVYR